MFHQQTGNFTRMCRREGGGVGWWYVSKVTSQNQKHVLFLFCHLWDFFFFFAKTKNLKKKKKNAFISKPSGLAPQIMGSSCIWYHVLNRRGLVLFQSRFRLASVDGTITIACVVSVRHFCPCNPASTPHWT